MNEQPNYTNAISFAIERLSNELSPKLTYHNLWHTRYDVIPGSARIAQHVGVSEDDMRLLEVAAAFHDVGFTEDYANHEIVGVRIASQNLPRLGLMLDRSNK
ncbi:MAG: HD domain-containing protein [Anaerolineae bacterium]|nr:HD domain-containing protein [Anaerolineae bacterium]